MPDLEPIHFDLPNVDIHIEPPANLPAVADALLNNQAFPDDAFTDGAIPLGSIKASASKDFKLDKVKFAASGGLFAGLGVYRSSDKLFDALKAEGLDEPMVTRLEFADLANKNLYAVRWGYDASGSISGSVALGVGLTFGASGRREALYAVLRSLDRTVKSRTALAETVNSWKMPRQIDSPDDAQIKPGTWLLSETDGELKLSLGVEYGYDYSWVREAVKIGGLSGDFGLQIEMAIKAAFGYTASGRYATVLSRENADRKLRLQVFKLRQQGWSFAFDASIAAQVKQDVIPDNFDEFIKGVFNLHGSQILKDIEKWLDPNTTLADLFGRELIEYAKKFVKEVTGFDPETEFDKAITRLRDVISRWQNLPHEITSLLYGLLNQGVPLNELKNFLKRAIELSDPETLKDEILGKLQEVDFFQTTVGKWISAAAGQGILSLLANFEDEREKFVEIAQKTLDLLDGTTVENTLKKLQKWIEEKLGLDKVFAVINETDFNRIDAWLKKRLSDLLGKTIVFQELEKIKAAINKLRENARKFYELGFKALTDKYKAEFHFAFQRSSSKTALLDLTFDFAANSANAKSQLQKALKGDFSEILDSKIEGVQLNKGVLTHEIKRNTHLEVKLPYFTSVRDHITESMATGEVVDAKEGRLWIFNLKASDIVKKKNSLSKLSIAVELSTKAGIRKFNKESFRYEYSLLMAKGKASREYLDEKLNTLVNEYFTSEFSGPGKESFSKYLTALDKALDAKGISGDDFFGNVLTSFNISLPGRVLAAWKNAPKEKNHPVYLAVSRAVQTALRRFIPLVYIQNLDQFKERDAIYPLLVYSALPPMNRVRLLSGGFLKFTEEDLYWDFTDANLRSAIFQQLCVPKLHESILPRVRDLLTGMPDTEAQYETQDIGKMLALSTQLAEANFRSLVFQESEIIKGIVKSGQRFREFLDAQKIEDAIEELAKFGEKITDAFNENMTSLYRGDALRPLGTLLLVKVAEILDPTLSGQIQPSAMLDIYVLNPATPFKPENFLKGTLPENEDTAVHQSIVKVGKSNI